MKLGLQDRTAVFEDDGQKQVAVEDALEAGDATVIYVESLGVYQVVMHNGQMWIGYQTSREVFDAYSSEEGPDPLWKAVSYIAAAILIGQLVVYFMVQSAGFETMWWRPLVATAVASGIIMVL